MDLLSLLVGLLWWPQSVVTTVRSSEVLGRQHQGRRRPERKNEEAPHGARAQTGSLRGDSGSGDAEVGSCVNAQRQRTDIGGIMINRPFSRQLFVCWRLWRQGRLWVVTHLSLFWTVDNMASVTAFLTCSICVSQRGSRRPEDVDASRAGPLHAVCSCFLWG